IEVVVLQAEQQAIDRDPGVRDQDVEATLVLDDLRDGLVGGLLLGDVETDRLRLAAGGADGITRLARSGLALGVVDEDLRARGGQGRRDGATDAARTTGDERDAPFETKHETGSSRWVDYSSERMRRTGAVPPLAAEAEKVSA